jgi:hypothetical protein
VVVPAGVNTVVGTAWKFLSKSRTNQTALAASLGAISTILHRLTTLAFIGIVMITVLGKGKLGCMILYAPHTLMEISVRISP